MIFREFAVAAAFFGTFSAAGKSTEALAFATSQSLGLMTINSLKHHSLLCFERVLPDTFEIGNDDVR